MRVSSRIVSGMPYGLHQAVTPITVLHYQQSGHQAARGTRVTVALVRDAGERADAFTFVHYGARSRLVGARIFNTRDGVVPNTVFLDAGVVGYRQPWLDTQDPTHVPAIGEHVFTDFTQGDIADLASHTEAALLWESLTPSEAHRYDTFESFWVSMIVNLERDLEAGAPVLAIVTEDLAAEKGWLS